MSITVIKLGGKLLSQENKFENVIKDIANLIKNKKDKIVLVHGGGPQINKMLRAVGKEPRIVKSVSGMQTRITDKETLEIAQMVMVGKLNKLLVSKFESLGIKSVGICGADGTTIQAKRKDNLRIIDEKTGKKIAIHDDYSGRIEHIDPTLINILLENDYLPIIAPIGIGLEYELLNLDADRVAGYIGAALKAKKLLLFTDVEGVIIDGKVIDSIGKEELKDILNKVEGGMKKKIYAASEALNLGIKTVYIGSGILENPISSVLEGKTGTVVSWSFV